MQHDPILEELEEDLRREKLLAFWRTFGRKIIAISVAVVALTLAFSFWQQYTRGQQEEATGNLLEAIALADSGKTNDAMKMFGTLREEAPGDIRAIATLREAALLEQQGKMEEANALYDAVAQDGGVDDSWRYLSRLILAARVVDAEKENSLINDAMLKEDAPFRHTSREMKALALLKQGKDSEARELFVSLADDPAAPATISGRAKQMLGTLQASK